jgi:hypothetical protein
MARTAITLTPLVGNSGTTATTTNIDIANGMVLTGARPEWTIFVITNTDTSPHVVTIQASDPVLGAGSWPNRTFSVPASSTAYVGPFESAKVQQKDGSVYLNFVSGHTGTVAAVQMPRGV